MRSAVRSTGVFIIFFPVLKRLYIVQVNRAIAINQSLHPCKLVGSDPYFCTELPSLL